MSKFNLKTCLFLTCVYCSWLFLPGCTLSGRSAEGIYLDFFGKGYYCTQPMAARDARAIDDCCVWLHFKACPEEMRRILAMVPYKTIAMNRDAMANEFTLPSHINKDLISNDPPKWWQLSKLGDSCTKFEYFHTQKDHAQFVYLSIDSTEAFYRDVTW